MANGACSLGQARMKFKDLQRKWYAKLKAKGFKDIEVLMPNGKLADILIETCKIRPDRHIYVIEEQASFYRLCSWFFHEYNFQDPVDKKIWELFSEGLSMRRIGAHPKVSLSVRSVHVRIHKIIKGPFQDYRKMVFHDAV